MIFVILQIDSSTQNKNENKKGDPGKDTSKNVWTSSDREKQLLAPSDPNPLAESKEAISEIKREDTLTTQPGDGKSGFHFHGSDTKYACR